MIDRWTNTPTPEAVMRISIFFDLRGIYGNQKLAHQLQQHMLEKTRQNTIFQAALATNVLATTPPLNLFKRFVVKRKGDHRNTLNLKQQGILPIVDMLRLHALAADISAINSLERADGLIAKKSRCLTRS